MLIGSRDFAHGTDHYYKGGDSRRVQTESRLHSKQQQGTRTRGMPGASLYGTEADRQAYIQQLNARGTTYDKPATENRQKQYNKQQETRNRLLQKIKAKKAQQVKNQ